MKRIVLLHVPNTFNYGNAAMGVNLAYYLSLAMDEDVSYLTDLSSKDDLDRFKQEIGEHRIGEESSIYPYLGYGITSKKSKIRRIIMRGIDFLTSIVKISLSYPTCIVMLGGDDLSEYYSRLLMISDLLKLNLLSRKNPVFLVGQTIGPFHSWRKGLAHYCLRNCRVYTRGPSSTRYVTLSLGLKDVFESRDLAFLDMPSQSRIKRSTDLLDYYGITADEYVTIVPSGLVHKYVSDRRIYCQNLVRILKTVAAKPNLRKKKLVLLAHVLKPQKNDDRRIIREIRKEEVFHNNKLVCIEDELLPSEARSILGNGLLTITGRMHAAVSTFQCLKPAISLSYGFKYKDVLGEGLGMSDLIIEAGNGALWREGAIARAVERKVDYVMEGYESIVERISLKTAESKNLAMKSIEDIAKRLREMS